MNPAAEPFSIRLSGSQLEGRTCLLGNGEGLLLHLPVSVNAHDETLVPSKWFGVAEFGRHYLLAQRVWVTIDGRSVNLNHSNQVSFVQHLDRFERTFDVEGHSISQGVWTPDSVPAMIESLEADADLDLEIEPQFDMRYYQALNDEFSGYRARAEGRNLLVSNSITDHWETAADLAFACVIRIVGRGGRIGMLPQDQRMRPKTFLVDERRSRAIHAAYVETHERAPDEAPIWDQTSTFAFAPARLRGRRSLSIVYGFDAALDGAAGAAEHASRRRSALAARKRSLVLKDVERNYLRTGDAATDTAYAQALNIFNTCLVARNLRFRGEGGKDDRLTGIFAGDKYFMDPWKRDENIALGALLAVGDYETARAILADTWRFQNWRTGRLPQIIQLGKPLVYYSSDGTPWALRRLYQYTRMSGDGSLLDEKYEMVERFFQASLAFVKRGLLPSGGIIDKAYLWETWEDTPYTPREGYPVEIELLWLAALRDFGPLVAERNPSLGSRLRETLDEGQETFKRFQLDGYLADRLNYGWEPSELLTPNGWVAFETGQDLPVGMLKSFLKLGRDQLAGRVGIRSLAPRDWPKVLSRSFLEDPKNVRGKNMASVGLYNYHRGVEWLWLNQFFVMAELAHGDVRHAFDLYVRGLVRATLEVGGVGGLSELYDLHGPLGADFQAWSMAGLVVALRCFAGIEVDAMDMRVVVAPCVPDDWTGVSSAARVGKTRFEVTYQREAGDRQRIEVRPAGKMPAGYVLRLGARMSRRRPVTVTVNGREIPADRLKIEGGTVLAETPFTGPVSAVFHEPPR